MEFTDIIIAVIGLFGTVVTGYIAYLKIVVPEKMKIKASEHQGQMEKLKLERDMWKEKAHALEVELKVKVSDQNEYMSALEAIEIFNKDENVEKVIQLLKSKLKSNTTPAML